jgi:hypothetical protein
MQPLTPDEAAEYDALLSNMIEMLARSRDDPAVWLEARPMFVQLHARLDDLARKAFPSI